MPPREPRALPKETTPPQFASGTPPLHISSSNDHNFFLQTALEIQRSIGKLEAATNTLVSTAEKHDAKIQTLNDAVIGAKGMGKAFGWVLGVMGAIGLALLSWLLAIVAHHFKW